MIEKNRSVFFLLEFLVAILQAFEIHFLQCDFLKSSRLEKSRKSHILEMFY